MPDQTTTTTRPQWVPGHLFLPRKDVADELARREALLVPSAIPCSLSPLSSRIHSYLFWDWRRTISSKTKFLADIDLLKAISKIRGTAILAFMLLFKKKCNKIDDNCKLRNSKFAQCEQFRIYLQLFGFTCNLLALLRINYNLEAITRSTYNYIL